MVQWNTAQIIPAIYGLQLLPYQVQRLRIPPLPQLRAHSTRLLQLMVMAAPIPA